MATWIVMMAFIAFLTVLTSDVGKKNKRPRLKDDQGDWLSCHAYWKFETWI
jgi:hypothetical protein